MGHPRLVALALAALSCAEPRRDRPPPAPGAGPPVAAAPLPAADDALLLALLTVDVTLSTLRAGGPGPAVAPVRWPIWLDDATLARVDRALAVAADDPDAEVRAALAGYRAALATGLPAIRRGFAEGRLAGAWADVDLALAAAIEAGAPLRELRRRRAPPRQPWTALVDACAAAVDLAPRLAGASATPAPVAVERLDAAGVACAAATAAYAAQAGRRPELVGLAGQAASQYLAEADRLRRQPPACCPRLGQVAQQLTYVALAITHTSQPAERAPP